MKLYPDSIPFGLADDKPCEPGKTSEIEVLNQTGRTLHATRLLVPKIFAETYPFDIISLKVNGVEKLGGRAIAASLFNYGELRISAELPPQGRVTLLCANRSQTGSLYFQAALLCVAEAAEEAPHAQPTPAQEAPKAAPSPVTAAPLSPPAATPVLPATNAESLPRVAGSTA